MFDLDNDLCTPALYIRYTPLDQQNLGLYIRRSVLYNKNLRLKRYVQHFCRIISHSIYNQPLSLCSFYILVRLYNVPRKNGHECVILQSIVEDFNNVR